MASDARRAAADARRIAGDDLDKDATAKLREALRANYERGKEAGRQELEEELGSSDARALTLKMLAESCDTAHSHLSSVPNSDRALSACREAAALLRDAATGESPQGTAAAKRAAKGRPKRKG